MQIQGLKKVVLLIFGRNKKKIRFNFTEKVGKQ